MYKNVFKILVSIVLLSVFSLGNIYPGENPIAIQTIRTTCLKETTTSLKCVYALPYPKYFMVKSRITSDNYIKIRYQINDTKYFDGWVAVYAVRLIYRAHP